MASARNNANAYEELRKKRLEENNKRMEKLNLMGLAKNYTQACSSASASKQKQKQFKPRTPRTEATELVRVRRSSRVANLPAPDYREASFEIPYVRRSYGRRLSLPPSYASEQATQEAAEHAYKIERELGDEYPTFVKLMLPSHVSGGFWLGLPTNFCKDHMPKVNKEMVLEDENGDESETYYLAGKAGLSAGWRGFSIDHGLGTGDSLVFQRTAHDRFKVYIVRASRFEMGNTSEKASQKEESTEMDPPKAEMDPPEAEMDPPEAGKHKRSSRNDKEPSEESIEADGETKGRKKPKVSKDQDESSKTTTKGLAKSGIAKKINNIMQARKPTRKETCLKASEAPVVKVSAN